MSTCFFLTLLHDLDLDLDLTPPQLLIEKDGDKYVAALEIKNVAVEDAGKYKVTAKNELGESNATISLNFDSKRFFLLQQQKTNKREIQRGKNGYASVA